jgi:hypothetical protein
MAEVLCTVIVVCRRSATLTQDFWCVLLTLGARSILLAAEDRFQKFPSQISLCVSEVSMEVGRVVYDVTCEQLWDLLSLTWLCRVGRNSSVGLATRFGLGCPGIEYWWAGDIFHTLPKRVWGLLYTGYWVCFLEVKRPGRGVDHPSPSPRLKKE